MAHLVVTRSLNNRGGQVILTSLIRALLAQGVAIKLLAFKPEGTEDFPDCKSLYEGIDVEIISIPARKDDNSQMMEYIHAARDALSTRQHDYEKVILDSWFVCMAGIMAQLDYSKTYHLVQSDPAFVPEDTTVLWKSQLFTLLPYYPMQRIVVSKSLQNQFNDQYKYEYPRIDLYVHETYRKTHFTVAERPVLRYISSASDFTIASKGLNTLLKSFAALDTPFELTIVSGKPIPSKLLSGYDYPITVTTAATPAEMVSILKTHDVYVSTSTKEAFGLALAEAISLGMPAVALDSVGNRDYNRGNNFIFVQDERDLTSQLQRVRSLAVRQKLHAKAKASMESYTLENMVRQFRDITGI